MKTNYSVDEVLSMQHQEVEDLITRLYFYEERSNFYYGEYNSTIPRYQMQLTALKEIDEFLLNNTEIDISWLRDVVSRGLYWETHRDKLIECLREVHERIKNS